MDIQKLINSNKIARYALELEYTDDNKDEIKQIINKLNKPLENKLSKFDDKVDEIEKLTMKKMFFRLKQQQKINLLKEYFKSNNVDEEYIEDYANNILEFIKDKTLKNKDIEYDIDNIKITNINNITIVDKKIKTKK